MNDTPIINKQLPHSTEVEQMVLGILLVDESSYTSVAGIITNKHFYHKQHQAIFRHIQKIKKVSSMMDSIVLCESLSKIDELDFVGGIDYINSLVDCITTTSSLNRYLEILQEKYTLRELINNSSGLIEQAYNFSENNLQELITGHINQLSNLNVRSSNQMISMYDVVGLIDSMKDNKTEFISTNDDLMDKGLNGGLIRGELVILAAKSGMGKTATAINIFSNISKTYKSIFFSIEMSSNEIVKRLHRNIAGYDVTETPTNEQLDNLYLGIQERQNLAIVGASYLTIADIKQYIVDYKIKNNGIDVIFIDYLQLLKTPSSRSEYEALCELTRELKILAQEFNIVIVCLSQLSRNGTDRKDKRPLLSDLRGSGSIEQDADIVVFLHREEYYYKEQGRNVPSELNNILEVIISKFRRYTPSKMLYQCDIANSRLIQADHWVKSNYISYLSSLSSNK